MKPLPGIIVAITVLATVLLSACGDESVGLPTQTFPPSITITQTDFSFDPKGVTLLDFLTAASTGLGDTRSVRVVNEGSVEHTFTIDQAGVDVVVAPGTEAVATVPVDIGSAEFYCRFHRDQGMTGHIAIARSASPTR